MAAFHSATTPVAADQSQTNDAHTHTVEVELKRAAEKVINPVFSDIEAKMHRYPAIFRGLMSKDDRYFVPRCVAIGPYHHHADHHLQRAEEIKRAAAYFFCNDSGHSAEMVYAKILTVADDAKRCYDHDAMAGCFSRAEFATMMFLDGCFLLQYIIDRTTTAWQPLSSWFLANQESILRDIFLLENQVPWLVLDALMAFMPAPVPAIGEFISDVAKSFEARVNFGDTTSPFVLNDQSYRPAHLLDLLRYYQSGLSEEPSDASRSLTLGREITSLPQSSSAIDLAEIGIHLTNNKTARFRDMGVGKGIFFYKLFLAPLVMDDFNACWLLNMVALEISLATRYEDNTVRSYVLLIAMLMNREEDVHELRVKRILHGQFSDQRRLSFFSDLAELILLTNKHKLVRKLALATTSRPLISSSGSAD